MENLDEVKRLEEKRKRDAAISLLQGGIDPETVAIATEMSLEEVMKLKIRAILY